MGLPNIEAAALPLPLAIKVLPPLLLPSPPMSLDRPAGVEADRGPNFSLNPALAVPDVDAMG